MKKTLIALAAAATVATGFAAFAAPANAGAAVVIKVDNDHRGGWDRHDDRGNRWGRDGAYLIERRISEVERRISDGRRYGNLSRREASRLSDRLDSIKWTKRDYERSGRGLDRSEIASLDRRLDDLSRDLRSDNHDRNRW